MDISLIKSSSSLFDNQKILIKIHNKQSLIETGKLFSIEIDQKNLLMIKGTDWNPLVLKRIIKNIYFVLKEENKNISCK
jgi:hypothetical protein